MRARVRVRVRIGMRVRVRVGMRVRVRAVPPAQVRDVGGDRRGAAPDVIVLVEPAKQQRVAGDGQGQPGHLAHELGEQLLVRGRALAQDLALPLLHLVRGGLRGEGRGRPALGLAGSRAAPLDPHPSTPTLTLTPRPARAARRPAPCRPAPRCSGSAAGPPGRPARPRPRRRAPRAARRAAARG